jgi:DNA-binding transcriptional LysR family regulator
MFTDLNLNRLRVFHAVARLLSFTRASEELHLTQPGISKHVKELEGDYGTKLFNRLGRKVVLTQAGEILFKTTSDILKLVQESKTRIDDLHGLAGGRLSIGSSSTIGTYLLPALLVTFRHKYPEVEITVDISLSQQVVEKVLNNTLELGLVGHYAADRMLVAKPFMADPMVLIVSARHPWTTRKSSLHLHDLSREPFLFSRQGSGTREVVESLLEKAGVTLENTMDLGTTTGVKHAVEAGLGVSILSHHVVAPELANGRIKSIRLMGMNLKRNLYLVHHKDRYFSEAARAFLGLLQESMVSA